MSCGPVLRVRPAPRGHFRLEDIRSDGVGRAVHADDHQVEAGREVAAEVEVGDIDRFIIVGVDDDLVELAPVSVVLGRELKSREGVEEGIVHLPADFNDHLKLGRTNGCQPPRTGAKPRPAGPPPTMITVWWGMGSRVISVRDMESSTPHLSMSV